MGERYIKTHCSHCGGGIEFPEDGLGLEIACPHCQEVIALVTEANTERPLSRSDLLFLSKFRFESELGGIGNPEYWESILNAPPAAVADEFVKLGLLQRTAPNLAHMLADKSSKELKELARVRGLSESGTKQTLGKRLADADPPRLYRCA